MVSTHAWNCLPTLTTTHGLLTTVQIPTSPQALGKGGYTEVRGRSLRTEWNIQQERAPRLNLLPEIRLTNYNDNGHQNQKELPPSK